MPSACSVLGAGLALYLSYRVLDFVWLYARPSGLGRYLHRGGRDGNEPAWALVTGATDGIGKAISFELAARGFNVVLHGRNQAKLERVRAELSGLHPARSFRSLVADAFDCCRDEAGSADLEERLLGAVSGLHLTVLVNCAGAGPHPAFGTLESYGGGTVLSTLHLNAACPALVSRALAPVLRSRGPALLINIASVTDTGLPLVSFYCASKAFGHVLSMSLWRETRLEGHDDALEVVSHRVGATTATSFERRPSSLFWPSAETLAKAVLARTGCGRKSVVPYWPHALQQVLLALVPEALSDKFVIEALRGRRVQQDAALARKEA